MTAYSLSQLAGHVHADLSGDSETKISGVGSICNAAPGQITFFDDARRLDLSLLKSTEASAVILKQELSKACDKPRLILEQPRTAFITIARLFAELPQPAPGVHPTATVEEGCRLGKNISVGPGVSIGRNTVLGDDCVIGPNCSIAEGCTMGAACYLFSNVTLNCRVRLGQRVMLHSGAVIGADGFGLIKESDGHWSKIPHCGSVVLGDDVEIGANTTVDRGMLDDTVIGEGVKIDNQVQIAHNVQIGAHTAIAGCVGIAGSVKIGRYCQIGGAVGINGHVEICDKVIITGMSSVEASITEAGYYSKRSPRWLDKENRRLKTRLEKLEERLEQIASSSPRGGKA